MEDGALSLDDPVAEYFDGFDPSKEFRIKHILSHTSKGIPGEDYKYSGRFGLLRRIIEQASGGSYSELLQARIFDRAGMADTMPMVDQAEIDALGQRAARPYSWRGETVPGHYELGLSSSTGLASTARDLARFDDALEAGELVSAAQVAAMQSAYLTSAGESLPYGYGTFAQKYLGVKLVWSYGQVDCFSGLYLKVPDRNLTLIILANNNLMSDPARLLSGDVTDSLFALSFLKHFVYRLPEIIPFDEYGSSADLAGRIGTLAGGELAGFYREELLAHALAAAFFGISKPAEMSRSKDLLEIAYQHYPDLDARGDLSFLHNLNLVTVTGDAAEFGPHLERVGILLLSRHPNDPFANLVLGSYYAHIGLTGKAAAHYREVANAENYDPGWYTQKAAGFLSRNGLN